LKSKTAELARWLSSPLDRIDGVHRINASDIGEYLSVFCPRSHGSFLDRRGVELWGIIPFTTLAAKVLSSSEFYVKEEYGE
jgi:hypothetical protein